MIQGPDDTTSGRQSSVRRVRYVKPPAAVPPPPNLGALWAHRQNIAVFLQILGSSREGLSVLSEENPDEFGVHFFLFTIIGWDSS